MNRQLLISKEEIAKRVSAIAKELDSSYPKLTIVMILKGAFVLTADLVRCMTIPTDVETIECKSYVGTTRGPLTLIGLEKLHLQGQDVLIVDDIIDSGETLAKVRETLLRQNPKSLKTLTLLAKKRPRVIEPDYSLFDVDDHFVIGYGLDLDGLHRGLPDIYTISE